MQPLSQKQLGKLRLGFLSMDFTIFFPREEKTISNTAVIFGGTWENGIYTGVADIPIAEKIQSTKAP